MLDYKKAWKELHKNKAIDAVNVVQYFAIKTIKAKETNKTGLLKIFLKRAFSPTLEGSYSTLLESARYAGGRWYKERVFGKHNLSEFLSEDEIKLYDELLSSLNKTNVSDTNFYSYIFVRQDLKPEYQLVQAAHATCVLGSKLKDIDPANLYFVVVGVENLDELNKVAHFLEVKSKEFVDFVEPDIGNEVTALATLPIHGDLRGSFKKFKLLTF